MRLGFLPLADTHWGIVFNMAHVSKNRKRLVARIKRIRGQIDAVERGLDNDVECADILQLVAAARGGMNGLMAELMEDHLRHHVLDPEEGVDAHEGAEELIEIIRTYLK